MADLVTAALEVNRRIQSLEDQMTKVLLDVDIIKKEFEQFRSNCTCQRTVGDGEDKERRVTTNVHQHKQNGHHDMQAEQQPPQVAMSNVRVEKTDEEKNDKVNNFSDVTSPASTSTSNGDKSAGIGAKVAGAEACTKENRKFTALALDEETRQRMKQQIMANLQRMQQTKNMGGHGSDKNKKDLKDPKRRVSCSSDSSSSLKVAENEVEAKKMKIQSHNDESPVPKTCAALEEITSDRMAHILERVHSFIPNGHLLNSSLVSSKWTTMCEKKRRRSRRNLTFNDTGRLRRFTVAFTTQTNWELELFFTNRCVILDNIPQSSLHFTIFSDRFARNVSILTIQQSDSTTTPPVWQMGTIVSGFRTLNELSVSGHVILDWDVSNLPEDIAPLPNLRTFRCSVAFGAKTDSGCRFGRFLLRLAPNLSSVHFSGYKNMKLKLRHYFLLIKSLKKLPSTKLEEIQFDDFSGEFKAHLQGFEIVKLGLQSIQELPSLKMFTPPSLKVCNRKENEEADNAADFVSLLRKMPNLQETNWTSVLFDTMDLGLPVFYRLRKLTVNDTAFLAMPDLGKYAPFLRELIVWTYGALKKRHQVQGDYTQEDNYIIPSARHRSLKILRIIVDDGTFLKDFSGKFPAVGEMELDLSLTCVPLKSFLRNMRYSGLQHLTISGSFDPISLMKSLSGSMDGEERTAPLAQLTELTYLNLWYQKQNSGDEVDLPNIASVIPKHVRRLSVYGIKLDANDLKALEQQGTAYEFYENVHFTFLNSQITTE